MRKQSSDDEKYYEKVLRTVTLFTEKIVYNHFGVNVGVVTSSYRGIKEVFLMSTVSCLFIAFIQPILKIMRYFSVRHNVHFMKLRNKALSKMPQSRFILTFSFFKNPMKLESSAEFPFFHSCQKIIIFVESTLECSVKSKQGGCFI